MLFHGVSLRRSQRIRVLGNRRSPDFGFVQCAYNAPKSLARRVEDINELNQHVAASFIFFVGQVS